MTTVTFMTKEEFLQLQSNHPTSGLSLKVVPEEDRYRVIHNLHPRHDPVEDAGVGVLALELVLWTAEVVADLLE